ncbi:MAG: malto-oligosyltrehalose trehalohydrolase, partial [Candidatus Omnitrophica bacterium]|nr:malto-oligosyltrehalose trehalohydrolase [Candidatus Omnitrophota bacterium]
MKIGAWYQSDQTCTFTVWAPKHKQLYLKTCPPVEKLHPMRPLGDGYWQLNIPIKPQTDYSYHSPKMGDQPDPASFQQPHGVHGPSRVIDHNSFVWDDGAWKGIPIREMIIYELHVGCFHLSQKFNGIIERLDDLKELGVNTIELMPIAQFPGTRNWGYDGVNLFAVQNSYGHPDDLKDLINICHKKGFAVILDVVYNHLGPEGNSLHLYGPYFTNKKRTPWGRAINFDDKFHEQVRHYFFENARYWLDTFHFDGLRLDAVQAIFDSTDEPFLAQLADTVDQLSETNSKVYALIAESDMNDRTIVEQRESRGLGLHASWSDDFHHALHALLTGERNGYYQDFGGWKEVAQVYRDPHVLNGCYSTFRKNTHGTPADDLDVAKFIVYLQNHDQVGNRILGERLSSILSFEELKLAAGCLLLSPYTPMLFMGEEYGENNPFLYFTDHADQYVIEGVRRGRRRDAKAFQWKGTPPDPQ